MTNHATQEAQEAARAATKMAAVYTIQAQRAADEAAPEAPRPRPMITAKASHRRAAAHARAAARASGGRSAPVGAAWLAIAACHRAAAEADTHAGHRTASEAALALLGTC